jgi:hypothetical protein
MGYELLRCVTVNLGLLSSEIMRSWADDQMHGEVDVVFAQELPEAGWPASAFRCPSNYRLVPDYAAAQVANTGRRAALLIREPHWGLLTEPPDHVAARLAAFGSYLAAAMIGDVLLVSVHASPTLPGSAPHARLLAEYPAAVTPRPAGPPGTRFKGELWASDLLLHALAALAADHQVVAAGDWNEARGWDQHPPNAGDTWGADFFQRVADAGLVDCSYRDWGRE